jgi:hypothetical protein
MIRVANRELLEGRLSDRSKWLIDAILSFMCVSVLRTHEQPNYLILRSAFSGCCVIYGTFRPSITRRS